MSRVDDHLHPKPCRGSKTSAEGNKIEEIDKVILIDVDSKQFDNVIFIDLTESLPKKSQSPNVPLKDRKCSFKNVIYIDDDDVSPDSRHYINVESNSDSSDCDNYLGCEFTKGSSQKVQDQCEKTRNVEVDGGTKQCRKRPFSSCTSKFKNTAETPSFGVKQNAYLRCSYIFNDPDFDDFSLDGLVRAHERENLFDPLKRQSPKRKEDKDDHLPSAERCLYNEREMLKETSEYKKVLEEEQASRRQALQIQAEEARHMRRMQKRINAENMRLLDMESKQKQRVEELRITQEKDVDNMNLKEVIRAEIIKVLKKVELSCNSLASLLHALGIRIGGWPNPSPEEVRTAYKRALVTFHPDRTSKTDIRKQVEAAEKFKLVNRMKEKLAPLL